jgi:pyruvate/2-oxoglutarate dehydrogenase complex dihydrolipoamide acyltransferase (E2) component
MANVQLAGREDLSPFRKIALGTWQTAYDPSIYGTLRIRMDAALRYIERFRAKYGKKLTVTHLVAKALGLALKKCPEANAILRFNSIYRRETVDISILVLMQEDGKADLSAAKVSRIDEKSLVDIVAELEERAARIRARQDKELEQTRQSMKVMPAFFMNALMKLLSFLLYTLNLDLRWAGLPRDAFGSAIVTSIGSLGLEVGYVPIVPYTRVPIYVAPGVVTAEPVVEGDRIVIGQMMNINATFDHRIIDGAHAAVMSRVFREVLEDPEKHLDPV